MVWAAGLPGGAADPIFVTFQTRTPEAQFPGALGVALPLQGSHACVFYDRVLRAGPEDSRRVVALLAHVMARDAHLLQGIIGTLRAEF